MRRSLKIASIQTTPKIGDMAANLEQIIKLIGDASSQGAEMVIFPELALTGYNQDLLGDKLVELALIIEDEPIQRLARTAKDHNVFLVVGFIEKWVVPGNIYDSIVMIDNNGVVLGT